MKGRRGERWKQADVSSETGFVPWPSAYIDSRSPSVTSNFFGEQPLEGKIRVTPRKEVLRVLSATVHRNKLRLGISEKHWCDEELRRSAAGWRGQVHAGILPGRNPAALLQRVMRGGCCSYSRQRCSYCVCS